MKGVDGDMPTSSITKRFIIKDDETCMILAEALAEPRLKRKIKKELSKYEIDREKLKLYLCCYKEEKKQKPLDILF